MGSFVSLSHEGIIAISLDGVSVFANIFSMSRTPCFAMVIYQDKESTVDGESQVSALFPDSKAALAMPPTLSNSATGLFAPEQLAMRSSSGALLESVRLLATGLNNSAVAESGDEMRFLLTFLSWSGTSCTAGTLSSV